MASRQNTGGLLVGKMQRLVLAMLVLGLGCQETVTPPKANAPAASSVPTSVAAAGAPDDSARRNVCIKPPPMFRGARDQAYIDCLKSGGIDLKASPTLE